MNDSTTLTDATLTEAGIQKFAEDWYRALDVHAPMVDLLPMLADEELVMKFPEATARGYSGFEAWYQRVIRIFFDEVHTVKKCKSDLSGDKAEVEVVVQWEASVWNPPDAQSKRIKLDAYQTWIVAPSPRTGKPIILSYTVDRLEYHEGSAKL